MQSAEKKLLIIAILYYHKIFIPEKKIVLKFGDPCNLAP